MNPTSSPKHLPERLPEPALLVVGLQQRLLSSVEAFARSLAVHRRTVERQRARTSAVASDTAGGSPAPDAGLFTTPPGADDERAEWTRDEIDADEARQVEAITTAAETEVTAGTAAAALRGREQEILDRMQAIAEGARGRPDAKTRQLIDWIREHCCPDLPPFGETPPAGMEPPRWNARRVLIFTENREGTKRYLRRMLEAAIADTDRADDRIATIDGLTAGPRRKELQRRFNDHPLNDALRILLATDAAREGLNFQAHCTDLFHFDLPWNPGRIEQRNGRIDCKLQPADEVRCHYFVLPQRDEDRVLDVLVRKTETIRRELGSLSKVIDDDIERRLSAGIRRRDAVRLAQTIEQADLDAHRRRVAGEELESARARQADLQAQIDRCRRLLDGSRRWVAFEREAFRDALSCSLELIGAAPLREAQDGHGARVWTFPPLDRRAAGDGSWTATLDSLRAPRRRDQPLARWRQEAPIRPVVFADAGRLSDETVHLHLEQRVAQRLLAGFRSQGFIHDDLSRACLAQAADAIPRVILLGRLSLYGRGAQRLHEDLAPVTARWTEPSRRTGPLAAYARAAETRTMALLERALGCDSWAPGEVIRRKLLSAASRDVEELRPQLETRAKQMAAAAARRLAERGERESRELREVLVTQRTRVAAALEKHERQPDQLVLDFSEPEKRQLQSNMAAWRKRLERFDIEIEREPGRVRAFYEVQATRVEPVGLVYLWPESN